MRPRVEASIEKLTDASAVQKRQAVGRRVHASRRMDLELQSIDRRADVRDLLFTCVVKRPQGFLDADVAQRGLQGGQD
jgi:hypothetical protein